MTNEQLVEYLLEQEKKGYTLEQLYYYLVQYGYDPYIISQAVQIARNKKIKNNKNIFKNKTIIISSIIFFILIIITVIAGILILKPDCKDDFDCELNQVCINPNEKNAMCAKPKEISLNQKENQLEIKKQTPIYFEINNNKITIITNKIHQNQASLAIKPITNSLRLQKGQIKDIDCDDDNKNDFRIKLLDIISEEKISLEITLFVFKNLNTNEINNTNLSINNSNQNNNTKENTTNHLNSNNSALLESLKYSAKNTIIEKQDFKIKKGEKKEFYFAIKNKYDNNINFKIKNNGQINQNGIWNHTKSTLKCYNSLDLNTGGSENQNIKQILFNTPNQVTIEKNQSELIKGEIQITNNATLGFYYCSLIIENPKKENELYSRNDFFIEIIE